MSKRVAFSGTIWIQGYIHEITMTAKLSEIEIKAKYGEIEFNENEHFELIRDAEIVGVVEDE